MKIETERVISIGVGGAMVLGFVFGWGAAKMNPTIVSAQGNGDWSVTVEIPDCGKGDVEGKPTHHLTIMWPERSGDVATIACTDFINDPDDTYGLKQLRTSEGDFVHKLNISPELFKGGPVEQ